MSDSLRNFAYFSSYLHLKSFAWKQDCTLSSKLQTLGRSYRVLQVTSKWKK